MIWFNKIGVELVMLDVVYVMIDVIGFGLLGYLCEMMEVSIIIVYLQFEQVFLLDEYVIYYYLVEGCVFGGIN